MKTDPEQIPSQIFDWLAECDFESLDAARQQQVLRHLSAAEFNELRQATQALGTSKPLPQVPGHERRKAALQAQFEQQHQRKPATAFSVATLWRIAAVLLLSLSGWMYHWMNAAKPELQLRTVTQRDTVWVRQEVPLAAHYEVQVPAPVPQKRLVALAPPKQSAAVQRQSGSEMSVLTIGEMGAVKHQPRGNSLAEDSLVRRFAFATL